jgi:hypothetical protein
MRQMIKENAVLRRIYYRIQMLRAKGQSDESDIISRLATSAPRTFVEFGFHPVQFNCAFLAKDDRWQGLLIDGNEQQISDAAVLLPSRLRIVQRFLTRKNLGFIKSAFEQIGILSIDVDGNDYWFLQELIDTKPAVICVEYNSSFGLEPITVPYDPLFDRHEKHPRGWYHGASLTALAKLCANHGYGLAAISDAGANAFFTRDGMLDPEHAWKPSVLRQQYSGSSHDEQWRAVKDLPFERI